MSQSRHLSICCLFFAGLPLTERIVKTWKMQNLSGVGKTCRALKDNNTVAQRVNPMCSCGVFSPWPHRQRLFNRGSFPGFSMSTWLPAKVNDHRCQGSLGVGRMIAYFVRACVILECGASGFTVRVWNHTGRKKKRCGGRRWRTEARTRDWLNFISDNDLKDSELMNNCRRHDLKKKSPKPFFVFLMLRTRW